MALTPDIAGAWQPMDMEPDDRTSLMPQTQFELKAAAQQMPGGATMDSRRMRKPKIARPPSGTIDWRDLQKEQQAKKR